MEQAEIIKKEQLQSVARAVEWFGPEFLDGDLCRQYVYKSLHPAGAYCPGCHCRLEGRKSARFWQGKTVKCRCGKTFSARTGTALAGKGLSARAIVLLLWLLARGDSDLQIAKSIGCNRETVRLWRRDISQIQKEWL